MRKTLLLISLTLIAITAAQAETYKNWDKGLIEMSNQFPLALNHNSLRPTTPKVLATDESELSLNLAISNTFIKQDGKYTIDGEYRTVNLGYYQGISEDLQLGVQLPIIWRGAGFMDSLIDDFHRTFGLPRGDRVNFPEDQFGHFGLNEDGGGFVIRDDGLEIGDLTVRSKYNITEGDQDKPAWALIAELTLPTASNSDYGQGAVDLLLGALVSKRWDDWSLYGGASYIYYGDDQVNNVTFEENHLEGFLGGEYSYDQDLSLNVVFYLASDLISSIEGFPSYQFYIDTGLKYKSSDDTTLEFLIRENPAPSQATTDVTLYFGVNFANPFA